MAFGLLNMPAVQEYAKDIIVKELEAKIGTELGIRTRQRISLRSGKRENING